MIFCFFAFILNSVCIYIQYIYIFFFGGWHGDLITTLQHIFKTMFLACGRSHILFQTVSCWNGTDVNWLELLLVHGKVWSATTPSTRTQNTHTDLLSDCVLCVILSLLRPFCVCGYYWKMWLIFFFFFWITCLSADFGVSAKNSKTLQRRDSFIGTPYWWVRNKVWHFMVTWIILFCRFLILFPTVRLLLASVK